MTGRGPWGGLLESIAADVSFGVQRIPGLSLEASMTRHLYIRHYLGLDSDLDEDPADRRPLMAREDPDFGRELRQLLGNRYHWQDGWRCHGPSCDDTLRWVARDLIVLRVDPDEVRQG